MDTLTVEQTADYLKVHPRTIQLLARKGTLRGAKIGRRWVFRRTDIDAFLEGNMAKKRAGRPRAA